MSTTNQLKVGDKIRIVSIPGGEGYYLHPDTRSVYERLLARKRPVKIMEIDKEGTPWFSCRFGKEKHFLTVRDEDRNWVQVKSRRKI